MVAGRQRRLKVFCVTCSFAPDDLFFPLVVTAAIKGTWFIFSFAVCLNLFFQPGCADGISAALAVSAIGFTCLQLLAFVHKFVLLLTSARGTIREPNHTCVRELLLTGVAIYVVEVVWAVYSVVAVLTRVIDGGTPCERLRRPIAAYVILVWLNWLELAVLALVYFSCLDRCKCFFCHAVCSLHCRQNVTSQAIPNGDGNWNVEANIRVLPTSRSISASHLCSIMREKLCTCRRDGLNNSKNVALLDLSHAMEVLFHDMEVHYTALDRLSGWILVQKYHSQLLRQGESSVVTEELLKATLRFLKKKGVIDRFHEIRQPQPLEGANKLPETLLYYFWFAMAAYGWSVKVFLEPLSGTCTLCRGARCSCCVGEQQVDEVEGQRGGLFLKSAEVASIAGINVEDVVLGKTANDIHCPPFFVCRTTRRDTVTGETKKELVITIRGTLSVKDVMTSFTASMRDATKCQESLVEKWFELLLKTKLTFLGVQDAYFHTGFYKSAKVILNILRKSKLFRDLVEKEHYRVVVAGHSLGAGVGAVLTLLIKQKHPHWANGLHAYLYSIPGAVCSYKLAERAEELGVITSVVGAYDLVPRISWRALTYLKLLVKKALDETDLKKQEILCCSTFPHWDPPIFGGSVYPVGLIDERSGAATPDFLELQESLPVIRRGTWDQVSEKRRKKEASSSRTEGASYGEPERELVEDEDVEFQERRRSKVKFDREESLQAFVGYTRVKIPKASEHCCMVQEQLGPPVLEVHSEEDEPKRENDPDRVEKVATEFLQEDTRLGPLMFIPGRILHIEEGKGSGATARWCGVSLLGLRCCGVRCIRDRQVRASWKAREDMTGIVLHHDCIVDHSPRRLFSMLSNLANQMEPQAGDKQSPNVCIEHNVPEQARIEAERPAFCSSSNGNTPGHELDGNDFRNTATVEVHDHSL